MTSEPATPSAQHAPVRSIACLNCGAQLDGSFCAKCGQRDIPPYPSVRELAMDAVSELSGWDGRLASTIRTLVRRPGLLTREFLEGRRVRYISPLRLYLITSLVYFLLAASAPNVSLESGMPLGLRVETAGSSEQPPPSRPERVAARAGSAFGKQQAINPAERDSALADIARAPALMQPFLRRAVLDPGSIKRGLLEAMPRMLFALLPVFAGILAIFYRGRKYPEHLYFAIHLHTFIFLALALSALAKFTGWIPLMALTSITVLVWMPIYATLAFRRVYGGSVAGTLLKALGIGTTYAITAGIAFLLTIYWVSVAP